MDLALDMVPMLRVTASVHLPSCGAWHTAL